MCCSLANVYLSVVCFHFAGGKSLRCGNFRISPSHLLLNPSSLCLLSSPCLTLVVQQIDLSNQTILHSLSSSKVLNVCFYVIYLGFCTSCVYKAKLLCTRRSSQRFHSIHNYKLCMHNLCFDSDFTQLVSPPNSNNPWLRMEPRKQAPYQRCHGKCIPCSEPMLLVTGC